MFLHKILAKAVTEHFDDKEKIYKKEAYGHFFTVFFYLFFVTVLIYDKIEIENKCEPHERMIVMTDKNQMIIEKVNHVFHSSWKTISEVEDALSERFQEYVDEVTDAQVAFDTLDLELDGMLSAFFCYTLSAPNETWSVSVGEEFVASKLNEYIKEFTRHYGGTFHTLEDLTSKLEHRVMKDMSNVGCDAKSALRMILEEDLGLENVFAIIGADNTPRIESVS